MSGQLIMQAEYSQATNAIDVTGLSNGIYLVEISDENSGDSIVKQFVKN
ncbi:T9SS type A sorting domain-containing protein [Aquimarina agarivorans]